jgi:hypothetical protein
MAKVDCSENKKRVEGGKKVAKGGSCVFGETSTQYCTIGGGRSSGVGHP